MIERVKYQAHKQSYTHTNKTNAQARMYLALSDDAAVVGIKVLVCITDGDAVQGAVRAQGLQGGVQRGGKIRRDSGNKRRVMVLERGNQKAPRDKAVGARRERGEEGIPCGWRERDSSGGSHTAVAGDRVRGWDRKRE